MPCITISRGTIMLYPYIFFTGLIGLSQEAYSEHVEPFLPGHVETYKLDMLGKASFEERIRFHKIGETPAYKTVAEIQGITYSILRK